MARIRSKRREATASITGVSCDVVVELTPAGVSFVLSVIEAFAICSIFFSCRREGSFSMRRALAFCCWVLEINLATISHRIPSPPLCRGLVHPRFPVVVVFLSLMELFRWYDSVFRR